MVCWLGDVWGLVWRVLSRGRQLEAAPSAASSLPDLESDPSFAKGLTSSATEGRIDMHAVNTFFQVLFCKAWKCFATQKMPQLRRHCFPGCGWNHDTLNTDASLRNVP